MNSAVIVEAVRTPIGRSHAEKGWLRNVRSDDLAAACVRALVERTGIAPAEIEDVVLGTTVGVGEQGFNVARNVSLLAGLPFSTTGVTVNRLCASSLQALMQSVHAIWAGEAHVQVVGGLEHMHHFPMSFGSDPNPLLFQRTSPASLNMGVTAEFLAKKYAISREAQDAFALRSHTRAAAAQQSGKFRRELVPVTGHDAAGLAFAVDKDQSVRPETSLASLAQLSPAFLPDGGTVTAGNSSPLSDGASCLLVLSENKAQQLGLKPLVKVRSIAVTGMEPCQMGLGPVSSSQKALAKAGLKLAEIDLIELNEAFAAQALACTRLLDLDEERLNVWGGALAIGHPLGASGSRITTTLISAMLDRQVPFGLATMCIGMGQGMAVVLEQI